MNAGTVWVGQGGYLNLLDPDPRNIHLDDIARSLSRKFRFNGMTSEPYSVAEHSCECSARAEGAVRLAALFHDAPEYVIGDLVSPAKALCPDYQVLEARLMEAVIVRFDLPRDPGVWVRVHEIDMEMRQLEARSMLPGPPDWVSPGPARPFYCVPPNLAEAMFKSHAFLLGVRR